MSNNKTPTVPSGHVLVFRRSANTNSFGLRGYWTYDPASGIIASCGISDFALADVFLGAVLSIDSPHIKSAELKQTEGVVKADKRDAMLAACWDNIRDQCGQGYIDNLVKAQDDSAAMLAQRNARKNAAHVGLYSTGATKLGARLKPRSAVPVYSNLSDPLSVCEDCGDEVDSLILCPSGAQVCRTCFNKGCY